MSRAVIRGSWAAWVLAPLLLLPFPAAAQEKDPRRFSLLVRGGYFGIPDTVADRVLAEHPPIDGYSYGAELRYHGTGGPRGVASLGIALERTGADAEGTWRQHEDDEPAQGGGDVSMTVITLTGYWNIYPSWPVHPYVGLGIGAARYAASYREEGEPAVEVEGWAPVLHVPLGLAVEFGDRATLAIEARVLDGVALGGMLALHF